MKIYAFPVLCVRTVRASIEVEVGVEPGLERDRAEFDQIEERLTLPLTTSIFWNGKGKLQLA